MLAAVLGCGGAHTPTTSGANTGDLDARLHRLELQFVKYAEALDFLSKVYEQQKAQQAQQEREEPAADAVFAVDIAQDVQLGQVDGPVTAPVTVVKCFDFACPYCQRTASTMDELVKEYGGKLRVVYKNLVVHPEIATQAHLASCAAAKQGKYVAFKTAVWTQGFLPYAAARDPSKLGKDNLLVIAKDVGLDLKKLQADWSGAECAAVLANDMKELEKFHVDATPTFFINGIHIGGALDKESFKQLIDERLKIVEASGVPAAEYYAKEVMGKGEKRFRSKADPKPH
jgi:protein-disulfide isomerase